MRNDGSNDGSNEDATFAHFRHHYTLSLPGSAERFFYGILSQEERDVIASGLSDIVDDDLVDAATSCVTATPVSPIFRPAARSSR